LLAISNLRLIRGLLEAEMFLNKANIALGLVVEGLGVLRHGGGMGYCFRVGHGTQSLLCCLCLPNVIKFGV